MTSSIIEANVLDGKQKMSEEVPVESEGKVYDLVNRRKIKALNKNIQELTEVTTILRSTMQDLAKYTHYSNVRNRVNDLFVFYKEVKTAQEKSLETLQRLKNEQSEELD